RSTAPGSVPSELASSPPSVGCPHDERGDGIWTSRRTLSKTGRAVRRWGERGPPEAAGGRRNTMQYLLLIYEDQTYWQELPPERENLETALKPWGDYAAWLGEKGWYLGGDALQRTHAATTVRGTEGNALTSDGPFAETKEQLAGFIMVDCENLDEAIEAASR